MTRSLPLLRFTLALFLVLPMAAMGQFGLVKPVTASLVSEQSTVAPGKPFQVAVKLVHGPTWHVYGRTIPKGATGLPTKVNWTLPEGWKVEGLPWPPTHELKSTGGILMQAYEGTVYLPFKLTPPETLAPGAKVTLEARVDALVCDPKSCMPVKMPVSLELATGDTPVADPANAAIFTPSTTASPPPPADAPAAPPAPAPTVEPPAPASGTAAAASPAPLGNTRGLFLNLLFAFVGGLILNVMPCVFPVLGIKILGVVKQTGDDKRQILLHGLAYTLGVLLCFWALSGVLLGLRAAGGQLSWGFQLQSPGFVLTLTLFLFAFGLNMAGLFEVGSSAVGVGSELTRKSGLGGSFFSGLLATVVATPCAAPFLAPALAYALSLAPLPSLLFFTVIGFGLAFPYLLLSCFPKLIGLLPRPGAWMESFKQAMSFLMFGTVAFLLWTMAGLVDEQGFLMVLLGLVLVALACWIYGRWSLPHKPVATRRWAMLLAALALGGGLTLAWPDPPSPLVWKTWSPELVDQLRAERKPVYIDFTARWCATCQTNKLVYHDASLQEEFRRRGVVTLKADFTKQDDVIFQAIKALGREAIPVNVLYVPGRAAPVMLPELLTVANVKAALAELDETVARQ